MPLADAHTHLNDPKFKRDLDATVERARAAGVELIINVGYDYLSSRRAVELAATYPEMYAVVGVHPHDAGGVGEELEELLRELAASPKVVAIGEIGLDYYRDLTPRPVQQEVFRRQLRLARALQLPVMIHDREAHADTLRILKEEGAEELGCLLHCFSGGPELAAQALEEGFFFSFGGPVTFKNARRLPEVVTSLPLARLLLETDAPYLTPEPHRGERNEPAYVRLVAEKIAALRKMKLEELAKITCENTRAFFRIS